MGSQPKETKSLFYSLLNTKTLVLAVFFTIFTIPFCTQLSSDKKNDNNGNYVIINGKKYTVEDLEKSYPHQMYKARQEYVNALERAFSEFASEKVVELEAKEKKLTTSEFMKSLENNSEPSDVEIQAVYNQYKAQAKGKDVKSLEEIKGDIVRYIKGRSGEDSKRKKIDELEKKYGVTVNTEKLNAPRVSIEEKDNPSTGLEKGKAKITVIEFSDFECPYCQRSQGVNKKLREKYKDSIRWVFRDYPLPFHDNAMYAHIAANCAIKEGKYWEMFQKLFENTGDLAKANVDFIAEKVGLNKEQYNKCVNDPAVKAEVERDIEEGRKVGVNGTPAFFINGIMVEGAQPYSKFEEIIEKELKK